MIRMAQRLLAFALAFVIIGGPVAGDICEAACAGHAGHFTRSDIASDRAHHHVAPAANHAEHQHGAKTPPAGSLRQAIVIPLPHSCDRVDVVLPESRTAMRGSLVSAMPAVALILAPRCLSRSIRTDNRHGPPLPVRAVAALRI